MLKEVLSINKMANNYQKGKIKKVDVLINEKQIAKKQ